MSKSKKYINNAIFFLILMIGVVFVLSIIGNLLGWEGTILKTSGSVFERETIGIVSLFSREGMRYIIGNSLSNFMSFTPLVLFLFMMIGVGFAERMGLFNSLFYLFGKKLNKFVLTYIVVVVSILSTMISDVAFVLIIPLSAILFLINQRNPLVAIMASFVSMASGYGFNFFISQVDFNLYSLTESAAKIIEPTYKVSIYGNLIFSIIVTLLLSIVITLITEIFVVKKIQKYKKEDLIENVALTKKEKRGLFLSFLGFLIFVLFFIYLLIPFGTPLSGLLLDFEYVDGISRIFSTNSFVIQGLSFIIFIMLIVCGLLYKLGVKEEKEKFSNYLYYSLNNIGSVLVLLFLSSQLIALVKKTNIGIVFTVWIGEFLTKMNLSSGILIIVSFILIMFVNFFQTSSLLKWGYLSPYLVPLFIKSNLTPEFSQALFRLADTSSNMITPFFPYFFVFLGILQMYNKSDEEIQIKEVYKVLIPYFIGIVCLFILIVAIFFILNLPVGISVNTLI